MVIFTMTLSFTMIVSGIAESQTRHISQTGDDGFITEAGILFDSSLVTILDPNMDIRAYLVFRMIEINTWEPLTNATLRLRVGNPLPVDAGSTVTIYGVDDGNFNGFATVPQVLSAPLTSQNVVLDTSDFSGYKWVEIDVTEIVGEIKSHPAWEGDDGFTGTIGFIFLGAEGHDGRFFNDKFSGNGLEAQLIINWGEDPPDPPDSEFPPAYENYTVEYVNTTIGHIDPTPVTDPWGGEIDIFKVTDYGDPEFQVFGLDTVNDGWYFNVTKGLGSEIEWDTAGFTPSESGALDPILGLDPWTLIFADSGAAQVYVSNDEFVSSVGIDPGNQYNLAPWAGNIGSMVIDPDGITIHLVWSSPTPAFPGNYNIIYTNFTLNRANGAITWAPSYTNVSAVAWTQEEPVIYVQPNGTLHVAWAGEQGTATKQIWYRRRAANGTWFDQLRISDSDVGGNPHSNADIAANDKTGDALIVWSYDGAAVYWEMVFPNNTVSPADRTVSSGRNPSMINDRENNIANLVYETTGGNPMIRFRNMTIANGSTWSASINISPAGEKHFFPDIGMNPVNRSISVVWFNEWNLWVAANWWNAGQTPIAKKTRVTNVRLNYNYIEEETDAVINDQAWFIAFANGTVIGGPFDTFDDAEEAVQIILNIHPADPAPSSQSWDEEGLWTRFRTRFYILLVGLVMVFGPLMYWAMSRPSGYEFVIGAFIMFVGFALMYAAGQV